MRTFLARLALVATDPVGGTTPSDKAFEIYTAWLHHVLSLVDQDRMQGYSSYLSTLTPAQSTTFQGLSAEEQKDRVFDSLLSNTDALLAFADPLLGEDSSSVKAELKRYVRLTPDEAPI